MSTVDGCGLVVCSGADGPNWPWADRTARASGPAVWCVFGTRRPPARGGVRPSLGGPGTGGAVTGAAVGSTALAAETTRSRWGGTPRRSCLMILAGRLNGSVALGAKQDRIQDLTGVVTLNREVTISCP